MKAKIFKPILGALIILTTGMRCFAQQAEATPLPPAPPAIVTPVAPMTVLTPVATYRPAVPMIAATPMVTYNTVAPMGDYVMLQDTNYNKKMKELNAKMAELRQQMNALRNEELKKQSAARAESTQRMYKERSDAYAKSFDRAFSTPRMSFDFDSDKKLQEKIKSGEVKELTKTFTKTYSVGKNDQLSIDNTYGKVTVNTWNKNEFKVDVEIKADANDQADAQKMLDDVSISDNKDGSNIQFKTNFTEKNHSWTISDNNGKYTIHRVRIDYVVYMPSKNALSISNKYGATTLPDFDGKLTINNSYGALVAKKLSNPQNEISTKYGSAVIETLTGSDLKVSYGSLDLGTTDNLKVDLSYSPAKIANIKTSGNINVRYGGGVKIGAIDKNLKNLTVNNNYSSVTLGVANEQNLDFDISVRYGSFNYGDNKVTVTDKTPTDNEHGWNPTTTYKGHLGKGSSEKVITIKSTYGSVKFD